MASASSESNSCGIPGARFVGDVDKFMKEEGNETAEKVIKDLEEQHNKYKFMEYNLNMRKARLQNQYPDIKSSLDVVRLLKKKKEREEDFLTHVEAADGVYFKAKVPPAQTVNLWLGANVMIQYELDEAEELLEANSKHAEENLEQVENDLNFLRDQTTTVEVNMARVFNWDVKRRQDLMEKPKERGEKPKKKKASKKR